MNKKLIALIAAAVLAILGIGAVALYAQGAENRAFDQASLTEVLVVRTAVPAGAQAQKLGASVELKKLPKVSIAEGAVTDLADLGDTVANGPLAPGDQVTTNRFSADGGVSTGDDSETPAASSDVPKGMQALEIPVAAPRVPSTVKTGSTIGMIGTYTSGLDKSGGSRMFLNRVKVVGVVGDAQTDDGGSATVLRLAVTMEQAQEITNVLEYGKLWITDQNAETDVSGGSPTIITDVIR